LLYAKHATSLLDEPVTEQSIFGTVVPRNLAFLADPIIAHALLGKEKSRYPELPSLAEAERRGYKLDAAAIMMEIRGVLVQGRPPSRLSKQRPRPQQLPACSRNSLA
jgi:hypothetical protein